MPNNYYERQSEMNPGELADGLAIEQEFDAIGRGFAKLPEPHRDGQGFEGPTRVGDPVEKTDAVNLGTLEKLNLPIYRKKITTEDWNTITDGGIYDVANASGANKPPSHPYGTLIVYKFNDVVTQIYYPDIPGKFVVAIRVCAKLSELLWGAWDGAFPANNVVGSASDGAIIEQGVNANGEYVKFADGSVIATNVMISAVGGVSWNYPTQMIGTPRPVVSSETVPSLPLLTFTTGVLSNSVKIHQVQLNGLEVGGRVFSAIVKCRWK